MVYVLFAEGFEEVEALVPVDYLKRAGIAVTTVGITGKTVTGSHKIPIVCDITADGIALNGMEGIILPGGMPGTLNLEASDVVQKLLDVCSEQGLMTAAICAAPSVLGHKDLLRGKKAVCYPGFEKELYGACVTDDHAVAYGNVITAKGAGAATEFAFKIIEYLKDSDTALKVKSEVQTCYR